MTAAESELGSEIPRVSPLERERTKTTQAVAAGLAHELRNPVFAIASAARLLRYRVIEDPVIEKNVGRILREAERLNALVSALLEFGLPAPIRPVAADPDEVWALALHAERGVLESKALIVQHTAAAPRATCGVDVDQWLQVCSHLLSNAIDAAPAGTDINLVSSVLPNGDWRSTLSNRSVPGAPDTLVHAFDLLVSTKPGRAGIGLAIVRRIVCDHGGTVTLESDAGSDVVATVTLPALRVHD